MAPKKLEILAVGDAVLSTGGTTEVLPTLKELPPAPRLDQVTIGDLRTPLLVLEPSLTLQIRYAEGRITVWNEELQHAASAATVGLAIEEFQRNIRDRYFALRAGQASLTADERIEWERLRRFVVERHPELI